MSFSKKTLLTTMLCVANAQAHNEPGFFEQVKTAWKSKTNIGLDSVEMHPAIQEIANDAQKTVGVAKPLPLAYMNPQNPITQYTEAITTKDGMYLNPATLQKPYGILRSTLFHEAVHAKYEDHKTIEFVVRTSALTGAVAGYAACRKLSKTKRFAAVVAGQAIAGHVSRLIALQIIEARADREGFRATGCGACLGEMAAGREITEKTKTFNPFSFFGEYMSAAKTYDIAKEFEGKTCTYHATPEKQAEAKSNISIMQAAARQTQEHYAALAEMQAAEHAVTDKEEQCMRRFQ